MKIENINLIERENILKEAEILEILASKGMTFDDLKNLDTKDLKNLFGENIYQSYLNFLRDTKNGAITKENIELFKSKLSSILDNFFDKNSNQNIGDNLKKDSKYGKAKIYFETISEEKFKKDLGNIINFVTNNTGEEIEGLSFSQICDGYINYRLGIKSQKKRQKYYGTIVKFLKAFKEGIIKDLKTLDELFSKEKIKIDELQDIIKEFSEKTAQEYFGEKFDEKTFRKDLDNITDFKVNNKIDDINGLTFRKIYDGYLDYVLGIKKFTKRQNYYAIIVSLLKEFKDGIIKDLKNLNELFEKEKIKIDDLKENQIESKEYFGENFDEKTFKNDLENITKFKTNNTTDKIEGLTFGQIYDGYLNYILNIKEQKERVKYHLTIIKLLKEFKEGTIKDLKTLKELFNSEKIKVDEFIEFEKGNFETKTKEYFGENFDEKTFRNDLENIKVFNINNKKDKIKLLTFGEIYNGYLNYRFNITEKKERQKYYLSIIKLLKEFKEGKIKDLKTLDELFNSEKVKIDNLTEVQRKSEEYFGEKFDENTFRKDLRNIKKFKKNNTTDKIEGLSFLEIIDGYLNYRLGIKKITKRRFYYGSIIKLLEKFRNRAIINLKDIDKLYLNIN